MRLPWLTLAAALGANVALAQPQTSFREAPSSARDAKSPFAADDAPAVQAGAVLFAGHCAKCHGPSGGGMGNVPALNEGPAQLARRGELVWFLERGSPNNGMPPSGLDERQRWQVVTFLKQLPTHAKPQKQVAIAAEAAAAADDSQLPKPKPPFTDFRYEVPGAGHLIRTTDLPPPYESASAGNGPKIVERPKNAWPKVPAGFKVQLYADGLDNPRLMRTAPNGDIFLAESGTGKIRVLRGLTKDGKAERSEIFATGLKRPYGIAFYPPGKDPTWVYIGDTASVVRFPYHPGDLKAGGEAQSIVDLPSGNGHWTRDLQFSLDGKTLLVGVGSASNIDDPDTTPKEKNRADILAMNPDGSQLRVYAYGIRNAGGGLAVHPTTGELWCSVNERDGLGDNLVPDYITHVQEGGYYGWPWWYLGGHQDPRHAGKHPELQKQLITPDVLLQPHHASLQLAFYNGGQFPSDYAGDLFAAQHGSWNRSVRTGYEVIRVPLHQAAKATGEYLDFMTGFVVDNGHVWGRPVGITVAPDGALLVSDDGSNSIWRVSYDGVAKQKATKKR